MSKSFTSENLLSTFPSAMTEKENLYSLAAVTAAELQSLYEDNDLLALYARINELDEQLLDILAYDFKVDWWDENYSLEEKRSTLQKSWHVHRTLGTPSAVITAISSIYKDVELLEWWKYSGDPFYFKLLIDTGGVFADYDKLLRVLERVRFYKNLRSVIEAVEFNIEKHTQMYYGLALQGGNNEEMTVDYGGFDPENFAFLIDISGATFTDGSGNMLLN